MRGIAYLLCADTGRPGAPARGGDLRDGGIGYRLNQAPSPASFAMPHRSDLFSPPTRQRAARANSLLWLLDPLERDAGYLRRQMFGCDAAYLDGALYLVVADREPPWNGVMVCSSQDRHAALLADMPSLLPHPQLGKWLYLPQTDEAFETLAERLVQLALARDPRLGVVPKPRARRRKSWRSEE